MKIAFLGCAETMPGAPGRRADAFEHDLLFGALCDGLAGSSGGAIDIDWQAPIAQFAGIDLVLLGTAWNYTEYTQEFCARLEELESLGIQVCNPSAMVRWNADKAYLNQLEQSGIPSIPTLWRDDPGAEDVVDAFGHFGTDRVVVKRRIGAGAFGQFDFTRRTPPADGWRLGQAGMIQPFLPAVCAEGEHSFVFIEGEFSHAILKRPKGGDYRIQSLYGGTETPLRPPIADIRAAAEVVAAIPFEQPLYARIDMIRGADGILRLIEAELIEPYLYPLQRRDFGKAFARAIVARGLFAGRAPV